MELPTPEGFVLESPKEELEFESLTPPDDIYTQALTYKPSIKAAEYRLQGSLNSIRIAQSAFYPNSLSVPVWEVIIIRLAEDQRAASAVR